MADIVKTLKPGEDGLKQEEDKSQSSPDPVFNGENYSPGTSSRISTIEEGSNGLCIGVGRDKAGTKKHTADGVENKEVARKIERMEGQ